MTSIEKKIIIDTFMTASGIACGLCGDIQPVGRQIKFIEIRPPEKLTDIIPVCGQCKSECRNHMVEHYRREIRDTRALIVEGKRWKYERAIKYGMKPIEDIKVIFYYEKLNQKQ